MPMFAFSMPGWPEILVILFLALLLFGGKKLPELARALGQSINEFRKAKDEFDREMVRTAKELEIKEAPDKKEHKPS